jgi:uncharacterized protein (TIGR02646 family)
VIHIDRDRVDGANQPIRPDSAWFELAHGWTENAIEEGSAHAVRESVYRHPSVKVALEELFHRKCAYCETPLSEVDWQVEHFRPKGRVAERPDHPGYFWLVYTWVNLYPSCVPCNQNREDKPTWTDPLTGDAGGKADQFPIEDEDFRAMSPDGDVTGERPLLLDPCADQPETSLLYTPLGDINAVPGAYRAEASIQVLYLSRKRLRDRRKEHIEAVVVVLRLIRQLRNFETPERMAQMERDVEGKWFSDAAPFAGVARFVRRDPDAFGV